MIYLPVTYELCEHPNEIRDWGISPCLLLHETLAVFRLQVVHLNIASRAGQSARQGRPSHGQDLPVHLLMSEYAVLWRLQQAIRARRRGRLVTDLAKIQKTTSKEFMLQVSWSSSSAHVFSAVA